MVVVECRCGYRWNYRGRLVHATCPNCLRKTEVKEVEILVCGLSERDEREKEKEKAIIEDIKASLMKNLEKIARKVWEPEMDGWRFWVTGRLGRRVVEFSDPLTSSTSPNPANYERGEWLIEFEYWTDLEALSGEEIREAEASGEIYDIIYEELLEQLGDLAGDACFPAGL